MSRVTILIPAYNAEKYIAETIDSILSQTFTDFKVLIIDDGSIDGTKKIIDNYSDQRIIYEKNKNNMQITRTLNKGLNMIDSEYIVRMDADDIMVNDKIEKQVDFMDRNPLVAVSGTGITKFYSDSTRKKVKLPLTPEEVKTHMLFDSPLMHPTVIMRNSIIKNEEYYYNEKLIGLEDFGLWFLVSKKHKLSNLSESLLDYRVSESSITQTLGKDIEKYNQSYYLLYKEIFKELNFNFSEGDIVNWRKFILGKVDFEKKSELISIVKLSEQMRKMSKQSDNYDYLYFSDIFTKYLRINSKNNKLSILQFIHLQLNLFKYLSTNLKEYVKYFIQ